jgi:putative transposase
MTRGGLNAEEQIQRTSDHRDPKCSGKRRTVRDVCREHEISDATYYQWKSKYGGMQASDIKRLRELEDENRRLKQISADLLLENRALKDVIAKKL